MDRKLLSQHAAARDDIGDLVTRRPLPGPGLPHLDPFLFLNHHGPQTYPPGNRGLPFGPHPHRGFETVTFILDGELAHQDSGGHQSIIRAGGVQWMTAGRGLIHAELSPESFKRSGGPLEILQLWINLPAGLKMVDPAYVGLERDEMPLVERGGASVRLVSGRFADAEGPVKPLAGIELMIVEIEPGASIALPTPAGRTVFFYLVRGAITAAGVPVAEHGLARFGEEGDVITATASTRSTILFGHGDAFREPIVSHGPFVMNSREEIIAAVQDYQAGRFGGL